VVAGLTANDLVVADPQKFGAKAEVEVQGEKPAPPR
jgi:hypothetical protein